MTDNTENPEVQDAEGQGSPTEGENTGTLPEGEGENNSPAAPEAPAPEAEPNKEGAEPDPVSPPEPPPAPTAPAQVAPSVPSEPEEVPAVEVALVVLEPFRLNDEDYQVGQVIQPGDLEDDYLQRRIAGNFIGFKEPETKEENWNEGKFICIQPFHSDNIDYTPETNNIVDVSGWSKELIQRRVENGFIQFRP